jgi:glutamate synthase (NADPH/NADH) small chain
MLRTSSSHEEGGARDWSVSTERVSGENGKITQLHCVKVELRGGKFERVAGSEFEIPADLVLLAMGFVHPEHPGIVEGLGLTINGRGNIQVDGNFATNQKGVFAAGDCQRGQSLVVWAIAEGRKAARAADIFLMGRSELP